MRKRLSKFTLEQKPPRVGRIENRDSESPLVFRLTNNGVRTFTVRTRLSGKQVRFTYPHPARMANLEDARRWAHTILDKCQAGMDPREEEREVQREAAAAEMLRVANVVEVFIERHCKRNKSWRDTRRIFELYVLPRWRNRLLTEITRTDIASLLDLVEDRASVYRTNRVLAAVRKLFNWAISRGVIESSPITPGMARPGERSRERYLSPREIKLVWEAADQLGYPAGRLIQMLLVTGQRRSEVAGMAWEQVDLNERLWLIPAEQTKACRAHVVPLSDLAIGMIQAIPRNGPYLFTTRGHVQISGFAKWKKQLDARICAALTAEASELNSTPASGLPWRLHDLRRTVATHMEELGVPPHVIGSVLNHDPKGYKGITSVYTRSTLIDERRKALTAWGRYLSFLLEASAFPELEVLTKPEAEARGTNAYRLRQQVLADLAKPLAAERVTTVTSLEGSQRS